MAMHAATSSAIHHPCLGRPSKQIPMTTQENDVEREYQIHRTEEDYALAEFWKWALAFLIGVAMGCIGFVVDWGIQTLNDFKYYHTVALIASRGAPL